MPFKSDTVGNASKNESSFSKNRIHVIKILLAVPEAIPKRSANITMLGFRLSRTRASISCSQVLGFLKLYLFYKNRVKI